LSRGRPRGSRSARADEPEPLGSVLEAISSGRPWSAGIALGELGRRWDRVVGERLAVECSPAALEAGVLVVRVTSAAWGAQIRFLEAEIRQGANALLARDAVREVRVTVARRGEGG